MNPEQRAVETDRYIVDRLRAALQVMKHCRTASQRRELHVVLGAVAPEREGARSREGMIRRVADRLGMQRGGRIIRQGVYRPRAFDQAISRRQKFDEYAAPSVGIGPSPLQRPLETGEQAISHGRACTVVEIDHQAGTCKLEFEGGGVKAMREYSSLGNGKGGARLSRPPPSLEPDERAERKDKKADTARADVEDFFDAQGARSPEARDQVRRRVGVGLYQTTQALILYSTYAALYALFLVEYPATTISFSLFKSLRPWYVRRAKREVCLCKNCENFKYYKDTLRALVKVPSADPAPPCSPAKMGSTHRPSCLQLFDPVTNPPTLDDDDAAEDVEDDTLDSLRKLLDFCGKEFKSDMVKATLCSGALDYGNLDCIHGKCSRCGFRKLWSEGLRPRVIDANGNLRQDAPVEFQSQLTWSRIKSQKQDGNGAPLESKKLLHQQRTGTVVEFLDEFERDVSVPADPTCGYALMQLVLSLMLGC